MKTLEQIAASTGVSVSTISRVLHGRDDVSARTRELVLSELRRAQYSLTSKPTRRGRPPMRARATKRLAIVAHSHADTRRNPFTAPILVAALEAGGPLGAEMISVDWPNEHATPPELLDDCDAAIALSCAARHVQALAARIPVVTVDWYQPSLNADGVVPDYRRGAFDAVRALIAAGHTRIALTSATKSDGDNFDAQIYDGARRALDLAGIAPWEKFIGGYAASPELGYEIGKKLLQAPVSERPTALFGSDHGMLGALRAAHDLNIRVPDDLALVGVDDIELSSYSVPRLSTVRVDKEALARTAVERALWRINYPHATVCQLLNACQFIPRDSCGTRAKH